MKGSVKKKEERADKRIVKTTSQLKPPAPSAADEAAILSIWGEEVDNLLEKKPSSYEEAINSLIDAVVQRINPSSASKSECREYIYQFLSADPQIEQELRSIFGFKPLEQED